MHEREQDNTTKPDRFPPIATLEIPLRDCPKNTKMVHQHIMTAETGAGPVHIHQIIGATGLIIMRPDGTRNIIRTVDILNAAVKMIEGAGE